MLKVGEVDYSTVLKSNVICVEDDYYNDKYGCGCCCFSNKYNGCITDLFTNKFECRSTIREDGIDVHFEIHE